MAFWAYLLRCADGSYYAGHTEELDRRITQHQSGIFTGYTYKRRPIALVWSEAFGTREEARAVEHQIKGWRRAKKEALIQSDWETLSRLSRMSG